MQFFYCSFQAQTSKSQFLSAFLFLKLNFLVIWHALDHNFDGFATSSDIKAFVGLFDGIAMSDQGLDVDLARRDHVDRRRPGVAVAEDAANVDFTDGGVDNWQVGHFFTEADQEQTSS